MTGAIAELERKVDLAQQIGDHPWAAIGAAFGAGFALSASRADVKAAKATAEATRGTGSKLGVALDGVVAALIAGSAHDEVDQLPRHNFHHLHRLAGNEFLHAGVGTSRGSGATVLKRYPSYSPVIATVKRPNHIAVWNTALALIVRSIQ